MMIVREAIATRLPLAEEVAHAPPEPAAASGRVKMFAIASKGATIAVHLRVAGENSYGSCH